MGTREVSNSRYSRVGTMMTSSPSLFVLLLLFSFTTVCLATPEGDTLQGLQQYWNVSFGRSWKGVRPCHHNWLGVTCDVKDGHVIGLNLTWNTTLVALGKPIPPSIGQLTNLKTLVLTNMSLTGTLTAEIGKLTQLTTLDLTGNSIVGPIPEEITLCTNLQVLSFRQNNLGGQLPAFLGKLTKLVKLDLHKNSMWGGLPPEWGTMTAMQSMQLWENDLSGYIPDSWRNMTGMVNFGMGQLFLSGKVPDWLLHFSNMTVISIARNQFMGDFPTNIPHNSSNYSQFKSAQLNCNYLTGPSPINVPKPILYGNNCYIGQVDGDPAHDTGTTEYTQQNCKRTLSCPQFYKLVNQSNSGCAPCPNSQVLVDPSTCVCGKDAGSQKVLSIGGLVGGVGGGVVAILLAVLCLLLYKQKLDARKNKYSLFGRQFKGINDPWEVPKEIKRFTLQELEQATQEFSDANCIGHGGFGHVYRGTLEDGKLVAIKCASLQSTQGQAEFRNELKLLSRLHHRNLVILKGFCDDHGYQILVYEYLVMGNLHANLFGTKEDKSTDSPSLTAYQRLGVAVGIARGIEYLHSYADPPVIHRDLKPSNILLDEDMTAKIADFGISRVSAKTHVSTRALGTAGYQDPEYFIRLHLTPASDVYSFGIILLELITGQQAIDFSRGAEEFNLLDWVKPRYASGGISAILDPRLEGEYDAEMYKAMTDIAIQCSMYDRTLRPSTTVILSTLEPFIKVEQPTRSLSFAWSREHSFNMAESGFLVDVEGPNTEDLTTSSNSPPGHDAHRRTSSDEARNQINSHDRKPLEPR